MHITSFRPAIAIRGIITRGDGKRVQVDFNLDSKIIYAIINVRF